MVTTVTQWVGNRPGISTESKFCLTLLGYPGTSCRKTDRASLGRTRRGQGSAAALRVLVKCWPGRLVRGATEAASGSDGAEPGEPGRGGAGRGCCPGSLEYEGGKWG